jgi:hypothetical protein
LNKDLCFFFKALAQGALPQNAMRSWKNLLELSGDAWHGIGDTSTDVNQFCFLKIFFD